MSSVKRRITLYVILPFLLYGFAFPGSLDTSVRTDVYPYKQRIEPSLNPISSLSAEDITFDDSYFKGTDLLHPFEWWYFDAVFDNHYSVEFHIIIASIKGKGVVAPMLNIYHKGHLIHNSKQFLPRDALQASFTSPSIHLYETPFMTGYQDSQGNWIFNLSLSLDGIGVNLTYTSMTQGWKSNILGMWWWGVIQPKAQVKGTLHFDNHTLPVTGTGYHEHGWNATVPYTQGWYWGKFVTPNLNIIWTNVMLAPWSHHFLMVLNYDQGGYIQIPSDTIQYTMWNYTHQDGWEIPTSFSFIVEDEHLELNAQVTTQSLTHQISLAMFNYWRYHVRVQGVLQVPGRSISLDTLQIMDYTQIW